MGKEKEYKSYDSACFAEFIGARLAMEPVVTEGEHGPMVRLKVVATSRNTERFVDLWLECNVGQYNALAASYLQKGDLLHSIRGRLAAREWGDEDDKKTSICLERCEIVIPIELMIELKERGFEVGGEPNYTEESGGKKGKSKKKATKGGKPDKKAGAKKKVVEIPDDEDEDEEDEDLNIEDDEE